MQSSQLTALQNAKLLLEQCGCFRGPPGPTGPQGPEGPAGKTLFYYSDGVSSDPNADNIDGCVYGLFIGADGTLWRSQATTQIDSSFTASYLNGSVKTITKQSDGKILVGGTFTLYGASSYNRIIRFNSDGTVDSSFNIGTGFNNSVETIVVQSDGKILVGGSFITYSGSSYKNLVRLNSDGTLDTGFYSTPGFDGTVYSIAVQSDNKIVVGGQFENYASTQSYKLIRLTAAGFYDPSFFVDTGFDGIVYSVLLDSDNNVYVGGSFSSYKSVVISNGIVRILNDGTVDTTTFLTGTGFAGTVYFMRFMNSSTLLITGSLTSYNGTSINNLAEVSINGTLTNTFGSGTNGNVNVATVDLSSNYLFGGNFSVYNGTTIPNNIVRINSLGNVDTTYPFVVGFNNPVNSIYIENYSQLLVGGDFTQYNNSTTSYLTRLQEKPCAWINTGTNILGASSNYSTVTNALVSTVAGLGNAGYISSSQLVSTVRGLGTVGYVSSSQLVSSVAGLTNFISSYISSSQLASTVIGIAFSSFVSSINLNTQFSSTINGLGTVGYVSTSQLVSTVRGLGTVGYVSSTQLASTVAGLSQVGYVSSSQLVSTVNSLARLGYVSSTQMASTVRGLGTVGYVSSASLASSIIGLGTVGYISSASLYSSIAGLGTVGYVSTPSLTSTVIGLGTLGYISSAGSLQSGLTSSIIGLGTVGYVSSASLYSSIQSYNFVSTQSLTSTVIGLGSLGYISSAGSLQSGLTSSIIGLGTVGYVSTQSLYSSIQSYNFVSTQSLTSTVIGLGSLGYISSAGSLQSGLTSSIIGLGTVGYVSTQSLYSSIQSYNFISTQSLTSTVIGLGTLGYISSAGAGQSAITSSIIGLGTVGYVSTQSLYSSIQSYNFVSTQSLTSTVIGLGSLGYISSAGAGQSAITSSIIGLGTVGYVSTQSLYSSIQSYNFVSTQSLTSTVIGLGSLGYISSAGAGQTAITSSIIGLGTVGYVSTQSLYSSIQSYNFVSTPSLVSSIIGLGTLGYISSAGAGQSAITSSIIGLGTVGYLSSFNLISSQSISSANLYFQIANGSTIAINYLSSGNAFISSLNVNSLIIGSGTGFVDFAAIRALLVSSIQVNTGVLNASSINGDGSQIFNLNAVSSLSLQSTIIGLGSLGYISTINPNVSLSTLTVSSIFTNNISTFNINTSTFTASQVSTNQLVGTVITQTLNPFSAGAQLGFGSNTSQNGFYGEGHFRSTFTQVIQPTLDNDGFSNIVRINGTVSTQQITTSTITGNNIFISGNNSIVNYLSTSLVRTDNLLPANPNNGAIVTASLYPQSVNSQLGYGPSGLGTWWRSWFGTVYSSAYKPLSTDINSTINLEYHVRASTINVSTVSTQQIFAQTVTTLTINTYPGQDLVTGASIIPNNQSMRLGNLVNGVNLYRFGSIYVFSTFTNVITGMGETGQIGSTVSVTNTLSTQNQVVSSMTANDIITRNISSFFYGGIEKYNYISTVALNSTLTGLGTLGYVSTQSLYSTIESYNFISTQSLQSSIEGLGSIGYISTQSLYSTIESYNFISTQSLQSSIEGLATFGYISSSQLQSTVTGIKTMIIQTFTF